MPRLKITEVFYSLQGEADAAGWPSVFIRLTGCPLRCGYCDTAYAFQGGEWWELEQLLEQVSKWPVRHVCVTGGEPLAQPDCLLLLTALCDAGYWVCLETSGALDIQEVDARVQIVMDLKTPGSGEVVQNKWSNLEHLKPADQIKFVISNEVDYAWSRELLKDKSLSDHCDVLMSPVYGVQNPTQLADWILRDHLPVRFQMQLHKTLWGDVRGK